MWNPPIVDEQLATRRSALAEAADLLAELVAEGARTIVFMKSRKAVELMARFAQLALEDMGRGELAERIAPYRAGYTPQQRRELERRLVEGELLGVVSTDALELGIDIGSLDAAICVTFPGTVASLRQMWGRAGRRGRGLAVYVAGEDALDQFFCRHPDEFLDRPVEAAILDPENEQIHAAHVLCAAHEGPLEPADAEFFGAVAAADRRAARGGRASCAGGRAARSSRATRGEYPAGAVSLRSTGGRRLLDRRRHLGRAARHGRRRARLQHDARGRGLPARRPRVRGRRSSTSSCAARSCGPFEGDWYTQAKRETDMYIERLDDRREWLGVRLSFGKVVVTEQVVAYQTRRLADHEVLDLVPLDLPQTSFSTQALWYELPEAIVSAELPLDELLGALHAAEHAQIAVLPLLAMCDRWDIGGLSTNLPSADRRADDLHLRRPPGRDRDHPPRLPRLRRARRRRAPADRRVPVREGLPVVRAVAEVREPQRAAVEGGRGAGDGPDARGGRAG